LEHSQPHKPKPDDRDPVRQLDARPPLGIDQTRQRLTQGTIVWDVVRNGQEHAFRYQAELAERPADEPGDPIPWPEARDSRPNGFYYPDRLMTKAVGVARPPVHPWMELRGAHPTRSDPYQHLSQSWLRNQLLNHL